VSAPNPQLRIATLERELHWAQLKIQVLEERLRKQRILMLNIFTASMLSRPFHGPNVSLTLCGRLNTKRTSRRRTLLNETAKR
jgi:hypothetical protein